MDVAQSMTSALTAPESENSCARSTENILTGARRPQDPPAEPEDPRSPALWGFRGLLLSHAPCILHPAFSRPLHPSLEGNSEKHATCPFQLGPF